MDRHLFFDRALHAFEPDAKLVLEQLADGAHATIAEVIDIVRLIDRPLLVIDRITAHLQDVGHNFKEVVRLKQRILDALHLGFAHLYVEFQPAHA